LARYNELIKFRAEPHHKHIINLVKEKLNLESDSEACRKILDFFLVLLNFNLIKVEEVNRIPKEVLEKLLTHS